MTISYKFVQILPALVRLYVCEG